MADAGADGGVVVGRIKFLCEDGVVVEVEEDVMRCSSVISEMDCFGLSEADGGGDKRIPLTKIDSNTFEMIVKFARHHKDDPPDTAVDEEEERRTDDISKWDQEYVDSVETDMLLSIITAANLLDIPKLVAVVAKTLANMLKGKNVDDIRRTLGIEDDLSDEEVRRIKMENTWLEDL